MAGHVTPVVVSWSGGKDCCLSLFEVQNAGAFRVEGLFTTCTRDFDRISMHGVRNALLSRQAASLQLPLDRIWISKGASNVEYEASTREVLDKYRANGTETVVYGDLFLQDIRAYRDQMLSASGMRGLYPLWEQDTRALADRFLALGFKAIVVCVDPLRLDSSFVGRVIDESFLSDLPRDVDPCGENGEFHSFVFDGPNFGTAVDFQIGEVVHRDAFFFCDLIPNP